MILVTGASGFLGRNLVTQLSNDGCRLRKIARSSLKSLGAIGVGDIGYQTNWGDHLLGVATVIHLAARVHVMQDQSVDPLAEFRRVNVEGTLNLARQAASQGIRRFIFISSIKVNGEFTELGSLFTAEDVLRPIDPYGISKMEAELGLREIASQTGMEVVIIRSPLVYGPGVKANFRNMMSWLYKGVPLPFGAIHNKRSLVGLGNLVDLIITCIEHPNAANQVFMVSDDHDLSTTELLAKVASCMGKKPLLLPVSPKMLQLGLLVLGKKDFSQRLCSSLQVDISKTKTLLGWRPPISVDEELHETVADFLATKSRK